MLSPTLKFLRSREVVLWSTQPPNISPTSVYIIPVSGNGAGISTTAIVLLTVIPGVLLLVLGLWFIYWLYMRTQKRIITECGPNRRGSSRKSPRPGPGGGPQDMPHRTAPGQVNGRSRGQRPSTVPGRRERASGNASRPRRNDPSPQMENNRGGSDFVHEGGGTRRPEPTMRGGLQSPSIQTPSPPPGEVPQMPLPGHPDIPASVNHEPLPRSISAQSESPSVHSSGSGRSGSHSSARHELTPSNAPSPHIVDTTTEAVYTAM